MNKKFSVILLSLLLFVVLSQTVFAVSWWPLVPCGLNPPPQGEERLAAEYYEKCSRCDLFRLFKNIIDFVLVGLMPPVAAILFVWGGFLILSSAGNPGMISKGKTIFWNAVMGVAILSSSWLITNTIMKSLANEDVTNPDVPWYQFECRETVSGPPGGQKYACQGIQCAPSSTGTYTEPTCSNDCQAAPGTITITTGSLPNAAQGQSYSQTLSASGGTVPYFWSISSGALPPGLSMSSAGVITGTASQTGSFSFTVKAEDNSSPKLSKTKQLSITVGQPTGLCSQPAQLAASNNEPYPANFPNPPGVNAPELNALISCIQSKLPGQNLGSKFTYDNSYPLCNLTRGQRSCTTSCAHAVSSCHYGGGNGSAGSLAVDFGNEAIGDIIIQKALECGAKSPRCENAAGVIKSCTGSDANHVHVNAGSCDAN